MPDRLNLLGIRVETLIGVLDEERETSQELEVSVSLEYDFSAVAASDRIEDAVDYTHAVCLVREFSSSVSFFTLESFADRLARRLLEALPIVRNVELRVSKPRYTGPLNVKDIEVHVRR